MTSENNREIVEKYVRAMEACQDEDLLALFAEDAVYVEPFTGATLTHEGKAGIRDWMAAQGAYRPTDMKITVDHLDVEPDSAVADWTCTASVFPGPMRGRDHYTIRDGKITRLETTLLPPAQ